MPDVKNLREKTVILKIVGANASVSTNVISEDTQGLWFSGGGLISPSRNAYGVFFAIDFCSVFTDPVFDLECGLSISAKSTKVCLVKLPTPKKWSQL
jgi:hypothetical protein